MLRILLLYWAMQASTARVEVSDARAEKIHGAFAATSTPDGGQVQRAIPASKSPQSEDERLSKFWTDYYEALSRYYASLDRLDWVMYYKAHGVRINVPGKEASGAPRTQFAPVIVTPSMQWALPVDRLGLTLPPTPPSTPAQSNSTPVPTGESTTNPLIPNAATATEYHAARFGADEKECTARINELAAKGWTFVGPIGNGMTLFQRPAQAAAAKR